MTCAARPVRPNSTADRTAWFAGYRGDMAFAALIVGGGSSEYAVRMLKGMFEQLPPDYLA